jgi:hypothetical protein
MQQSRGQKLLYLVIFIILVGSLVFAIVSMRDTKKTAKVQAPSKPNHSAVATKAPPAGGENNENGTVTQSSQPASSSSTKLANTGPAETITLFVATAAGGTAAAHLYQRRRTRGQHAL